MDLLSHHLFDLPLVIRRQPILIPTLITAITIVLAWSIRDYRRFISLGKGGIPANVWGWLLITIVQRPFTLSKGGSISTSEFPRTGARPAILALPTRKGLRPEVGGIVPQRQLAQNSSEEMKVQLQRRIDEIVARNPKVLEKKLSRYEKHNPGIFVHPSLLVPDSASSTQPPETAFVSKGEIGHRHADGSYHLYFAPADARVVIEKGWGERHRLSRTQPWYFGGVKGLFGLMPSYVLVYGPRDEGELSVSEILIKSSACWMTGKVIAE